jgi:methionyl-tRNA formyltransferase
MRIVYFGTPAFSASFLQTLLADSFFDVVALVCQPDEPIGRKKILTAPATKTLFQNTHPHRPVFQPTKLKEPTFAESLKALNADAFVIVAYGRIIPQTILHLPKLGNVNVHPSLLPLWRGPSPLQATIAAGDTETGITIMLIDAEMDHGPLLAQTRFALAERETLSSLTERVTSIGTPLLVHELKKLAAGATTPQEQNHAQATFCKLLKKEDGIITLEHSAEEIDRMIRAYTPWPGVRATFTLQDGSPQEVKITNARVTQKNIPAGMLVYEGQSILLGTPTTALEIHMLQPATKSVLQAKDYMRGYKAVRLLNLSC